jgi:hypothetical protein
MLQQFCSKARSPIPLSSAETNGCVNAFIAMQHVCRSKRRPVAQAGRQGGSATMREPLPVGGYVRKLWPAEADAYRDHLLRLDRDSRTRRFGGGRL